MNDIDIGDSISHTIDKNLENTTEVLADTSMDLFTWFKNNGVKANVEKVHIVVISKDKEFTKIRLYDIYFPLAWMNYPGWYKNQKSTFTRQWVFHTRNLKVHVTEIFKL